MRISDWSSDVCSSDLGSPLPGERPPARKIPNSAPPRRSRSRRRRARVSDRHDDRQGRRSARLAWWLQKDVDTVYTPYVDSVNIKARDSTLRMRPAPHAGPGPPLAGAEAVRRSEEHTSELPSLMRIPY